MLMDSAVFQPPWTLCHKVLPAAGQAATVAARGMTGVAATSIQYLLNGQFEVAANRRQFPCLYLADPLRKPVTRASDWPVALARPFFGLPSFRSLSSFHPV